MGTRLMFGERQEMSACVREEVTGSGTANDDAWRDREISWRTKTSPLEAARRPTTHLVAVCFFLRDRLNGRLLHGARSERSPLFQLDL